MNPKHIIITRSGKVVEFGNVRETDITIEDIAHALSNLCRFTGHCSQFYSVASHSILVSRLLDGSPLEKMQALLHDAPEAYLNDLSSPLKAFIGGQYMEEHERLEKIIAHRFDLPSLMTPGVKLADWGAFLIEWGHLFPGRNREDDLELGIDMDDKPDLLQRDYFLLSGEVGSEDRVADFLDEYEHLRMAIESGLYPVADQSKMG